MSNKYQAYAEYKDSGVEWLGGIPLHWQLTRIKYITRCLDGARIPLNAQERGDMQGDIPYWGANKVVGHVNNYIFDEELILLGEDGAPFFDRTKEVAFNVTGKIWPNNHVHVLRPDNKKIEFRFLKYAINCADFHLYISGSTRDKLNQSDMNEIYIRSCQLFEQENIANFLDHETVKIDTLIEKQQQLIKLLKEKRQAVISHAVTKGLNPNAPMRDSGVEWLGEVPEHWDVISLKHLVSVPIIDGPHLTPTKLDEGIPFISAEAISQGYINFEKKWGYISRENHELFSKRYSPRKGDILMVKLGATTGVVAMVETDDEFNVWVPLATIRARESISPKFVFYLLQSSSVRDAIQVSWTYGTQQTLGLGTLSNLNMPVPSQEEAEDIVGVIESKIPLYDESVNKCEVSLQLLIERRTALISAAVTGKIDVRNWQAPNSENKAISA